MVFEELITPLATYFGFSPEATIFLIGFLIAVGLSLAVALGTKNKSMSIVTFYMVLLVFSLGNVVNFIVYVLILLAGLGIMYMTDDSGGKKGGDFR